MAKSVYDPNYWSERAARTRLRAEVAGGHWAESLVKLAEEYDRHAERAAQHGPMPSPPLELYAAIPRTPGRAAKPRFRWPI